jgi:DNA-binding beta-propeller fold protein YncE
VGAFTVTVSADGKSVYVVGIGDDTPGAISVFDRDQRTGSLRQKRGRAGCVSHGGSGGECRRDPAIDKPNDIVVSPDGRSGYVVGGGSNRIAALARSASGALTPKSDVTACRRPVRGHGCKRGYTFGLEGQLAVSADGHSLYLASPLYGAVASFDRNPATGALTQTPGAAGCITGSRFRPGVCGHARFPLQLEGIAISPDGTSLYAASYTTGFMATLDRDPTSGELQQASAGLGCVSEQSELGCQLGAGFKAVSGISVSPNGKNVYVVGAFSDSVAIFDRSVAP